MTVFEALKNTNKDDVSRGITSIIIKNIKYYAPETEISNFDISDIELQVIRWLDKEL